METQPDQPTTPTGEPQRQPRDEENGKQTTPNAGRSHLKFSLPDAASTGASSDNQAQTLHNSPGPFSSYSANSERQLGHHSVASDSSTDRVFPIRSVVSVDPTPTKPAEDGGHQLSDSEGWGGNSARSSHKRGNVGELRRADTLPVSPRSASRSDKPPRGRRMSTLSGHVTSAQQDGEPREPHGSAPLDLNISTSERDESELSGALSGSEGQLPKELDIESNDSQSRQPSEAPHVNIRFRHVMTEDGHAVITGRDGVLQRCEDEPIHAPGAVQGFGALVAIREEADARFIVRYASENSDKILGYSPRQLFKLNNFLDVLTEEQQDNLLDHIDFIRDEESDPAINGPEVFSLSIRSLKRRNTKLWCAIHINPAHPDLIICEFELDDDAQHPLRPRDENIPEAPADTLQAVPTSEELQESTEVLSKPLRILRSARKRRGEQGAMQVFDIMSQVQEQLSSAPSLESFLKILVGIVKELTGFHRVMIYQFDSNYNGKVVTELVDPAQTRDLYHGLNFPATDIPRQARELYKLNKVRLLYDRDLETARIVCRSKEDLDVPLDMSHSYLRAISPIHIKYLKNMAVRSSMSISINAFNELWGLIACHSYGDHGMRVSFPIRKMCRLVGDTASRNIERLSYASRLQARKLINTSPTDENPSGYIIASSDDLLTLFDADFGLLSIKGETKVLGTISHSQEALAMLEYLRMRKLTSVSASQDVRDDFPDLRYPPGFQLLAGLLYVPLSVGGGDFIVFFRKGQIKEVKWAGNPYEKIVRDGTAGYLEPRSSFKSWRETVVGKCREWTEEQVETAAVLCLVYGKFIEVWRQKEQALQSSKLTRLLLANSAHEVRTPLNAIINYLEIALEGPLDQETRDNLAKSHSASKSLIYVINDLLDLTKTEEGQDLIKDEIFELPACIQEATEPYENDAKRKSIHYEVLQHPGLPRYVHGDARRIRQALSNVIANAIGHTDSGFVRVEVQVSAMEDQRAAVDFVITDSGKGMNADQQDALFRDLEQVSTEIGHGDMEDEKPSDTRTLGLGLAVASRVIRNMDGQLRLKSEEGQGCRFVMQLPFHLPEETPVTGEDGGGDTAQSTTSPPRARDAPSSLAPQEGEITLVHRGSMHNLNMMDETSAKSENSRQSLTSHKSYNSLGEASQTSQKSDADRLIDAIQTPLGLDEGENGSHSSRPTSGLKSRPHSSHPSVGSRGSRSLSPVSKRSQPNGQIVKSPDVEQAEPGTFPVRDTKMPIRPVRVPDEYQEAPQQVPQTPDTSGVLFEVGSQSQGQRSRNESVASSASIAETLSLQVLIAEDDPINFKILKKRLERVGHVVHHAVNGEDCATVFKEKPSVFDVVLMDMQMPIVDGLTSTTLIRAFEHSNRNTEYSKLATENGRIPIFAVSASLIEKERQKYIDAGFDGWILKPVDIKRLTTLLDGIRDDETRNDCLYVAGEWERGGWFATRPETVESVRSNETTPRAHEEDQEEIMTAAEAISESEAAREKDDAGATATVGEGATEESPQEEKTVGEKAPTGGAPAEEISIGEEGGPVAKDFAATSDSHVESDDKQDS